MPQNWSCTFWNATNIFRKKNAPRKWHNHPEISLPSWLTPQLKPACLRNEIEPIDMLAPLTNNSTEEGGGRNVLDLWDSGSWISSFHGDVCSRSRHVTEACHKCTVRIITITTNVHFMLCVSKWKLKSKLPNFVLSSIGCRVTAKIYNLCLRLIFYNCVYICI